MAKKQTTSQIITRIVEQSNNRARKDIYTWRTALTSAENKVNPNRVKLYDLYEDLIMDNHMRNLQKRLYRMIAKNKVVLMAKNQVNEDATKLFNGKWYQNFVKYCADSRLFGHSLIEFTIENDKINSHLIPRKNVLPEFGGFKLNAFDSSYIVYRNDPFYSKTIIEVGDKYDLGDLCAAAPNILFKKNALVAWSEYTEIFGMPIRVGKTNSSNTKNLDRMESQMVQMGKAPYAVIDSSEEIEFVESTKGDAFNVYDKLIERMNSELSKLILGETLTTDVGANGSRAQSQVHQDVSNEVEQELGEWFLNIINEDLLPVLSNLGFNVAGLEASFANDNKSALDEDKWLNENFEIDPQFFADKYNIPITGLKTIAPSPTPPIPNKKNTGIKNKLEELLNNPIVKMHAEIDSIYNEPHIH